MIFNGTGVDYNFGETTGSLSGLVFVDTNSDGIKGSGEAGLSGVTVSLSGTDVNNHAVSLSTTTDGNGSYTFGNLLKGTYKITESQPGGYTTTRNAVGTINGVTTGTLASSTTDVIDSVLLSLGSTGINYNFGEIAAPGGSLHCGDTASTCFWNGCNGQALIKSLNGCSTSTALSNWLASTLPNLFGTGAGCYNIAGKTNAQVASWFQTIYSCDNPGPRSSQRPCRSTPRRAAWPAGTTRPATASTSRPPGRARGPTTSAPTAPRSGSPTTPR